MVKISGGAPGGWHGGQLPGASAPFRFRFAVDGTAEVDGEIATYLMSVPGPFALVADFSSDEPNADTPDTEPATEQEEKPKSKPRNRRTSLDE